MTFLAWLVVGFLAGWASNLITGRDGGGCCANVLVGVFGAFIGGVVMGLINGGHWQDYITGVNLETILVSVLGAIILVALLRLVGGDRRRYY
ncbi:MAG TPA: GlsB/YeaQ/YmgE family stress response membrane protein [Chloroflexia bacterium]|nr:GlsB/YeaQ/YmgE family stress response membrane protein [Chloroflexia bacterium]